MLLAIFFGLVAICGLFFGFGYSMGHRTSAAIPAAEPVAVPAALHVDTSRVKPSAGPQSAPAAPASTGSDADPAGVQSAPSDGGEKAQTPGAQPTSPGHAVVQPALAAANGGQSGASAATAQVQPAITAPASIMVQVAAVLHEEDADVLVGALRRRGYAATTHHDAGDGLIHVRVGPFASLEEASRWRSKLLNDGYNAIIE
jgi:cell division septation protein DedD